MIIFQRVLAVLAATFFVGAIAIAAIGAPDTTLGASLYALDRDGLYAAQTHSASWLWENLALPVLARPAWLLPVCIGVLCVGLALTIANRQRPQRTPRRRL